METQTIKADSASFRDPSGFVFQSNGTIYRQVNQLGASNYDLLIQSGLFERLVTKKLIINHQEVSVESPSPGLAYKILQPEKVPFISYPYEWSFSQLKDAALLTLRIQKLALKAGLSLKDCSAYNIQFLEGKPVFIDTLSFEKYNEGKPWVAYRQFCQHFLAPLALMHYSREYLGNLLQVHLDGIPLPLTSRLLPFRAKFNIGCLLHIFLHAKSIQRYSRELDTDLLQNRKVTKTDLFRLVDNLVSTISRLNWKPSGTSWGDYDILDSYTSGGKEDKIRLVTEFIRTVNPQITWDLGANRGDFSFIASQSGAYTIAIDADPLAIERLYLACKESGNMNLLPLVVDLTNPTPAIGWQGNERMSLLDRGPADLALALALIHHLAISNNVPFALLAEFFSKTCQWLVIEFIPKNDQQIQRMLQSREDIFSNYDQTQFEVALKPYFEFVRVEKVKESERSLYLMKTRRVS